MSRIEDAVCEKIKTRADFDLNKYGVTMMRDDLSPADWIQHAQDEAMDLCVYLQKILETIEFIQPNNASVKNGTTQ